VFYGPEDIVASELFRGVDADERLAEKADVGRRSLLRKGFGNREMSGPRLDHRTSTCAQK